MPTLLADARRGHRGLLGFAAAMAALTVVTAVLALVDHRTLLGQPLWFKPLKFSISFALYALAMAWMLGQLSDRIPRRAGWIVAVTGSIEMVVIVGQAARGVRSHFNDDDALGTILFAFMGVTIVVFWLATLAVALRFLRDRGRDRAGTLAIRLGLIVSLVGMSVGFVMSAIQSHAVGLPDGGPGLPFVGWSTGAGDLRPAHFIGLHALQILPLMAVLLARRGLSEQGRVQVVAAVAAGYLALVLLLAWQALRAQPLLAPDGLTLGVLALIVLGTAGGVVLRPRQTAAAR
jgi:uncharacterized membrane protein YhaH (DUF805 family)